MRALILGHCLVFLLIPSAQSSETPQELIQLADTAYAAQQYDVCANHYEAAIASGISDPYVFYNAACCQALQGNSDRALSLLDLAIHSGFRDPKWLQGDPDLKSLHDDSAWAGLVAKCQAAEESYWNASNTELYHIYQEDQKDRKTENINWRVVSQRDSDRRVRVREMLAAGEVKSADDHFHAAMIFQHGDDTTDYLLAHELCLKAVDLDPANSNVAWLAAASKDRYLWHAGQPQWYGTQFHQLNGRWTIEPIDTTVISDKERREWNVPTLAEAWARARKMNDDRGR